MKRTFIVLVLIIELLPLRGIAQEHGSPNPQEHSPSSQQPGPKTPPDVGIEPERQNTLGANYLHNLLKDQKLIWTSPLRLRPRHAVWIAPLALSVAGLLGSDRSIEKHAPTSPSTLSRANSFSNLGAGAMVAAGAGFYLLGRAKGNEHERETGVLASEAALNSLLVVEAVKFAAGRERPTDDNGRGRFFQGGSGFPSEHSALAWSIASVISHEYPGPLTKLLSYAAATGVSASRVAARKHFPADVFVGGVAGWLIGEEVYRHHHNPNLPGASIGTFVRSNEGERLPDPGMMGSTYLPADHWAYPVFDRLAALGYAQSGFAAMRPWTRLEAARVVKEIGDQIQLEDAEGTDAGRMYQALKTEFSAELGLREGDQNLAVRLESLYTRFTGIAGPPVQDGYHFAETLINDQGRPYGEGANLVTGFTARSEAGPLAFYVQGEFQHAAAAPVVPSAALQQIAATDATPVLPQVTPRAIDRLRLLDAYAALNLKNFQLSVGQQTLWWGPTRGGALMFSNNAEPIPMVRLSRVSPFKLPFPFSLMGPVRFELFLGTLGGQQFATVVNPDGTVRKFGPPLHPHPYIHGEKISFKPTPNLEFGFSETTIFSGPGFPLTWRSFFRSYGLSNTNPGLAHDPGDRRSGFDFSYRLPGLRNWVVLYNDSFAEDEISPVAFPRRSAMNPGVYLPRLPGVPKVDLRVEGVYTDLIDLDPRFFYFNFHYNSGYTNYGRVLGSWIGRGARGVQASSTYWLSPSSTIRFGYRMDRVNPLFLQGGALHDFSVRAVLNPRPDLTVSGGVQIERWKFPLLAAGYQTNAAASIQLTYWPHWKF